MQRKVFHKFPLPVAAIASIQRGRSRAKRLGHSDAQWSKDDQARYRTVQLVHHKCRWWLAYNGRFWTGGFKTRTQAVQWFVRDGR